MQVNENDMLLVESVFLLDEKSFKALRNYLRDADLSELEVLDELVYDTENNTVKLVHQNDHIHEDLSNLLLISLKVRDEYVVTNLKLLKKLFSIA